MRDHRHSYCQWPLLTLARLESGHNRENWWDSELLPWTPDGPTSGELVNRLPSYSEPNIKLVLIASEAGIPHFAGPNKYKCNGTGARSNTTGPTSDPLPILHRDHLLFFRSLWQLRDDQNLRSYGLTTCWGSSAGLGAYPSWGRSEQHRANGD